MTERATIDVDNRRFDVELNHESCSWEPVEDAAPAVLDDESVFPLFTTVAGVRHELFSDGSFAVAEN